MGQGPEPQSRCNRPFSKKEESNLERRTRGLTVLLFDLREGGGQMITSRSHHLHLKREDWSRVADSFAAAISSRPP